ncbi:MAG: hypothetical protein M1817_003654 [Caeruleum heppii]|nr:MAG: hypothetical protein M1817_003654 [Caeruleum heppii]
MDSVHVPLYAQRPAKSSSALIALPELSNDKIITQIFTHHSSLPCGLASDPNLSYDRLEFLGDAYLELIATRVIFSRFPNLPSGRMSQIRENLVCNAALAALAAKYGFEQRVKRNSDLELVSPAKESGWDRRRWKDKDKDKGTHVKIMADVFEAYVAGVVLDSPSSGFTTAEAWLAALWEPQLRKHDQTYRGPVEINPLAKQQLSLRIQAKNIKIDYLDERPPRYVKGRPDQDEFYIGAYLTDWGREKEILGSGTGKNKKEAGMRAAMAALENHPLIDELARVKEEHVEEVKRLREQEVLDDEGGSVSTSRDDEDRPQ